MENENKDVKELKNKILKVESENKNLNDMNKLLYERLSNVENEYINFLKKYSEDRDKEDMVDVTCEQYYCFVLLYHCEFEI